MHFPKLKSAFSVLGFLHACTGVGALATCYYPNGTAGYPKIFLPCNPAAQSMCCPTNSPCNNIGLCIAPDNNGVSANHTPDLTFGMRAQQTLCAVLDPWDTFHHVKFAARRIMLKPHHAGLARALHRSYMERSRLFEFVHHRAR